jgi:hypothetical protein
VQQNGINRNSGLTVLQSTDYVHEEMGGIVPLIRILSLSSVYPNVAQPTKGTFVRSRLARIASLANVKVVAPVALVEYGNPERAFGPLKVARLWQDGPVEVLHPSWFYPPFGGV